MKSYRSHQLLAGVLCTMLAQSTVVASYTIAWDTLDGGVASTSGGTYVLSGTLGQFDAGTVTGGTLTLSGGFWQPQPSGNNGVTFEWVTVGNPGNAADPEYSGDFPGIGSVAYQYRIAKHEVTNDQYVAFLNAVAATDDFGVFHTIMQDDPRGGILRSGSAGSYTYSAKADMGNKPATWMSFFNAMRFVNWLHNGQPIGLQNAGTTEDGVYAINDGLTEVRASDALFFLPTEHEWYKAAYHQPAANGGDSDDYWVYPTGSNSVPVIATAGANGDISNPGANVANYDRGADWTPHDGFVTTVGTAGSGSESYYGTADQGGNVSEWNEAIAVSLRVHRGGNWQLAAFDMTPQMQGQFTPDVITDWMGFRVAAPNDCDGDGTPDSVEIADCLGDPACDDCNVNGTPDACDIAAGDPDANLNGVPDSCEASAPPTVLAEGSRYLAVTPDVPASHFAGAVSSVAGGSMVALEITSPDQPCFVKYVDFDSDSGLAAQGIGQLVDDPIYRSPAEWGTVHVRGDEIVPFTTYEVRTTAFGTGAQSLPATTSTGVFGDVDKDSIVSVLDFVVVIAGFQGIFDGTSLPEIDLHDCLPNGVINVLDLVTVVDTFRGLSYTDILGCASVCSGSTASLDRGAAEYAIPTATAELHLRASSQRIRPGEEVSVEVLVANEIDLRAYQVAMRARSGSRGTLALVDIVIEDRRTDHAFVGERLEAIDFQQARAGVVNISGAQPVSTGAYLATFVFEASSDAVGTFTIDLSGDNIFVDADRREVPVLLGEPVTIKVGFETKTTVRGTQTRR